MYSTTQTTSDNMNIRITNVFAAITPDIVRYDDHLSVGLHSLLYKMVLDLSKNICLTALIFNTL